MSLATFFSLLGGLGLFLFGMKLMSEGLEKAAGAKLRGILEFFTKNRFTGMLVGLLFTAVVQSSSATTVMVVSFVNSGLMTLLQAAGVILGANIGTTITGQLIAFDLSDIAPLFVITGVVMVMFVKKQGVKRVGEVLLGFGILFMGLSIMGDSMSSIKDSPYIIQSLRSLESPLPAILVGFIITAILQSSSATVGIVILMASQGLLEFAICPFLILGCNIGSCVSALIASLGAKKDAKRAAFIHFLFNIIGSFIIFLVILIAWAPVIDILLRISGGNIARGVANAHTIMKVCEVIILYPFMGLIVKATYKIVPGEDAPAGERYELTYITKGVRISPAAVMVNVIHEIENMGRLAIGNIEDGMEALCVPDEKKAASVYKVEKQIDFLNREITDYLVRANELELPVADARLLGGLFHVVNDIERIGDHAENLADSAMIRINEKVEFSDKSKKQLCGMAEMVKKILYYSLDMFTMRNQEHLQDILELEEEIDAEEKRLQRSHVKRLTKNKCTPQAGMLFTDAVSGLERVADHATNIAFAIFKPEENEDGDEEE